MTILLGNVYLYATWCFWENKKKKRKEREMQAIKLQNFPKLARSIQDSQTAGYLLRHLVLINHCLVITPSESAQTFHTVALKLWEVLLFRKRCV